MPRYQVTRFERSTITGKREQVACYEVTDPGDIQYTDNDCVRDFDRGQNDYAVDRACFAPGTQITIRTRVASLRVRRIS